MYKIHFMNPVITGFFHKLFYIFHKSIKYKMSIQVSLHINSYRNETDELSGKIESY